MLPLVGGGIVAILLTCGLAVDVSYWRYQQRVEQAAADSAAVAGAISLNFTHSGDTSSAQTAALNASAANGFTDGSNTVAVSVTYPTSALAPNKNTYAANTAVAVTVSQNKKLFFTNILHTSFGTGSARAVAASIPDTGECLYQLQTNSGILTVNGKFPLNLVNCTAVANGTVNLGPNGCSSQVTGIDYWGPNNTSGVPSNCGSSAPLAGPANDPCPRIAGCSYLSNTSIPLLSGSAIDAKDLTSISTQAGLGYGVVKNCCVSKGVAVFAPGLYYIYGGISGTIEGDGVTIVNVDGAMTATGLGSAHPYWTAPTTGSTAGVAFYQPSSNTNAINLDGGGNGTSEFDGLFYAPGATGTSNGGSATYALLIIGDMTLNGGGSANKNLGLTIDPTLNGAVTPSSSEYPKTVVLTE